jgi:hypothetical protein
VDLFAGLPVLFFLGVVVLGVVGAWWSYEQAKKRRAAFAAYAASRGWTYVAEDPALVRRFTGPPFGRGFGARARNVLLGEHDGRGTVAFDYSYKQRTGSGKNRRTTTYHHSVVATHLGVALPGLSVTPENVVGRFFGRIFDSDVELDSEEFNRAFTVGAADRKFAYDVLHPQMMELLLRRPDLAWRTEGDSLVMVTSGHHSPALVEDRLVAMDAIADLVPEFVWRQLRGQA